MAPPRSINYDMSLHDLYSWVVGDHRSHKFSTAKTWDFLRPRNSPKEWTSSVWFKGATPRNAFTMWVAQLDRLPTRTRLVAWGLPISSACCLCSEYEESRDHLLLRCGFSEQIWSFIQVRLRLSPCIFYTWSSLIAWTRLKSDSAPQILRKVVAQAAVFHIWKQRNRA